MGRHYLFVALFVFTLLLLCLVPAGTTAQQDTAPPKIDSMYPAPNQTIKDRLPIIRINYSDPSGIDIESVVLMVNFYEVQSWDQATVTEKGVIFKTPEITKLPKGNNSISLMVADKAGNVLELKYNFTVNTKAGVKGPAVLKIDPRMVIIGILLCSLGGLGIFAAYIKYLMKTKKFTFKKYFILNQEIKEYLVFYIPAIIAFFFAIIGLMFALNSPGLNPLIYEVIVVVAFFIGVGPFTVETHYMKKRLENYERAFAQMLFELADAMRGGIDPAKAIVETAKTNTSLFKKHLEMASKNIRLGRPFEEVLKTMVAPTKSALAARYASLIGEASKVGGEISQVVHRAAKDMDDIIRIRMERKRQLSMQMTIIYISFGVLLIIVYMLLSIYPSLGTIDIGLLTNTNLESASSATVHKMGYITIKRRFLHLMIINSIGSGCLTGKLVDGSLKYGLVHAMVMVAVSMVTFLYFIP